MVAYRNRAAGFHGTKSTHPNRSPSFSGVGCKYYVNLRYDFTPKLSCWLKIAQTHYADDREKIGSSHEAIMGDRKTEIKCLVRLKF